MGYGDVARRIQDLYLDGKKDEAAAAVPTKLIEQLALIGPLGQDPPRPRGLARVARSRRSSSPARSSGCARPRSWCWADERAAPDTARGRARDRHGRGPRRDVRALPRRPGRRRGARRAAGRRGVARTGAAARGRQPAVRRSTTWASAASSPTSTTAAGRDRLRRLLDGADIWIETSRPGALEAARARPRRRPRAQPAPRRGLDHRLRPHRPLPRLGGDRRDAPGHGRRAEPLRPAGPRAADAAGRAGPAGHGDAGRVGGAGRLLERAGVRRRRPHRLLAATRRPPRSSTRCSARSAPRRPPATSARATGRRPARTRSSAAATVTSGSCCWRRASGTRCAPGSASPTSCRTPRWTPSRGAPDAADLLHAVFEEHFRDRGKHELTLEGQARGVPIAPVLTPADVLAADHFRAPRGDRAGRARRRPGGRRARRVRRDRRPARAARVASAAAGRARRRGPAPSAPRARRAARRRRARRGDRWPACASSTSA